MPHSHHSHSGQFCRHAKDTLEEIILEAIRQRFETYGLTEHCPRYRQEDLYPEEVNLTPSDLKSTYLSFLSTARSLQSSHPNISLLIGIETEYITSKDLDYTSELIEQHEEIQYVVGSIHHVKGIPIDFDRETWLKSVKAFGVGEELNSFFCEYFDSQYQLLVNLQPEVIGHFDLCLLYDPTVSLRYFTKVWEKVKRNVVYVVGYGGLFEANSAALRKGWEGSYPSKDVLELIIQLNGRICLSDDSHGVSQVGLNYHRMRSYLLSAGVDQIWKLVSSSSDGETVGKRGRVKAVSVSDWAEGVFWDGR
ncbi:hypothetical protein TREMEDRAFT_25585 [Tremella mesenterica DSM 1558]|uniref:uncharacterized protein n=1 Tax=Tremella mesenterica (strain ATCC 24925 / CBS 8224 / DSM 1558 / NBRC 9311 / NRRL Y-6157 / RJB 2259-6 / UBC 559-6) TaxID=578456 RepID=UPI0003F48F35|nr:uncharacterized protein TREMEDRAFT_25585 [Tremella mesenterica DSM 1558]EIW73693.1 hypothetical protein TREMEDRAFT_25585 [Tremella mesenterica DSM 1558]